FAPIVCNDFNVCTDDSCNPATGLCVYAANTAPCEDGNPCTTPDRCSGGACVAGPGLPAWYRDADADFYGDPASTPVCASTQPVGYVEDRGDCCDTNANVRPNQTSYFASAYNCGTVVGSFDYNCDGTEERRWTATGGNCIWRTGDCIETVGWQGGTAPRCGQAGAWVDECDSFCRPVALTRIQECR
ncbi:MAG: hypothetical protein QME96_15590, partial [Myxococcota bacterium]|nr:hypothetical protein [Myxococcota bacterium]